MEDLTEIPKSPIPKSRNPKLSKSQKAKLRDAALKENDFEEWQRKRDARNERRREKRKEMREGNPVEWQLKVDVESSKRKEKRIHIIQESPEEHKAFLESQKQKRKQAKIETWNILFDSQYEKYKSTFPTPISQKQWESLKQWEIDMLFREFDGDISISFLHKYRQSCLDFLRKNPNCPCDGSVIFYIKTFVHYPKDKRKITPEEIAFIDSLSFSPIKIDEDKIFRRRQYYENKREKEIELAKLSYQKKKSQQISDNFNRRFISADPNKVLSLNDICYNPFMTNYSVREEFKVNLWKDLSEDEKPEYLEKWKSQREMYEKEVEDLSVEYKTNFLKHMESKDYFDEWEKRKEKYLNHFRK